MPQRVVGTGPARQIGVPHRSNTILWCLPAHGREHETSTERYGRLITADLLRNDLTGMYPTLLRYLSNVGFQLLISLEMHQYLTIFFVVLRPRLVGMRREPNRGPPARRLT